MKIKSTISSSLFLLVFSATAAFAGLQNVNESTKIKASSKLLQKSNTSTSRWFDYGDAINNYYYNNVNDSSVIMSYPFFPDSTLKYNFSNGLSNTFHCIGNILQPTDTLFNNVWYNDNLKLLPTSTYTVDSIATEFFYIRNITNVTDSLIIKVGVNPTATQSGNRQFVANVFFYDNFGDSLVKFKDVPYSSTKNEMGTILNSKRIAIALDSAFFADTTEYGSNIIMISTADLQMANAGSCVYTSMSFKPGFTWNLNSDTLNTKNYIRYFYYKEQKNNHDNVVRYYRGDVKGVDYNRSYIVPTNIRYNNAATWNNKMYPRNAYSKASTQDQYYFQYKISSSNGGVVSVGINENSISSNNLSIYPNPTSNILNIKMNASNTATAKLININGQVVYTENVANKINATINMNAFAKGIYTLQIVSDKGVETKKVIKN